MKQIVIATDLNSSGEAVFRWEGRVGFVKGLLPGESGEVELTLQKDLWSATLRKRLSDSPDRLKHPCSHSDRCPASPLGCLSQNAEKEYKLNSAKETLRRIANISFDTFNYIDSVKQWNYRNKIEFSTGLQDKNRIVCGYHSNNQKSEIIPIKKCLLGDELINQFWEEFRENKHCKKLLNKIERIIIRSGNGVHFHFIFHQPVDSSDEAILTAFFKQTIGLIGISVSSTLKPNPKPICGELLLQGVDNIYTNPFTFRQINDEIGQHLQDLVIEWMKDIDGEIWDLFGGFGFLSYRLAKKNRSIKVFENSLFAIEDGMRAFSQKGSSMSYHRANLQNFQFRIGKNPNGIILDPPYSGAGKRLCGQILQLSPQKIAYISCHGATLARDLFLLTKNDYILKKITLLNMFPKTTDVEWFVQLERT